MAVGEILVRVNADVSQYERKMKGVANTARSIGSVIAGVSFGAAQAFGVMAAAGTAGVGALISQAAKFESAFTGVRKVMNGTEAEFNELSLGIRKMSTEIPMAADEIAGIAQVAGQLGIEKKHILDFTRTMADMGVATNMSAEEAATSLAQFANITGMSMGDVDRLGSTIVDLGNNLATTEKDIVNMGMRLAGAGTTIGLTEAEIMSFSGALSSMGIRAESGGTAFQKVMNGMNTAVVQGGEDLEGFAKIAGMSADEFAKSFKEAPAEAIVSFIEGLDNLNAEGEDTITMLDDLGLGNERTIDVLTRAANGVDLVKDALNVGTNAWEENVALTKEAEQRYDDLVNVLKIAFNKIKFFALSFGLPLLDMFKAIVKAFNPLLDALVVLGEKFDRLDDKTKQVVSAFIMAVPIVLGIAAALSAIVGVVAIVVTGFIAFTSAAAAVGIVVADLLIAIGLISGVLIGMVAAVGAGIAAFIALAVSSEEFRKRLTNALKGIYDFGVNIFEGIKDTAMNVWSQVVDFWNENSEKIKDGIMSIVDKVVEVGGQIKEVFENTFDGARGTVEDVVSSVLDILGTLIDKMQPFFEALKSAFDSLLDSAAPILEQLFGLFQDLWPIVETLAIIVASILVPAFGLAVSIFSAVITAIGPLIEAFIALARFVVNAINLIIAVLTGDFSGAMEIWGDLVQNTIDFIVGLFEGVVGFLVGFGETFVGFFKGLYESIVGEEMPSFVDGVLGFFEKLGSGILKKIVEIVQFVLKKFGIMNTDSSDIIKAMYDTISMIWGYIKDAFSNALKFIKSLVKGDFQGMKDSASSQMDMLKDLLSKIWQAIKTIMSSLVRQIWNTVKQKFADIKTSISNKMSEAKQAAVDKISGILTSFISKGSSIISSAKNTFLNVKNGIRDKMTESVNTVKDKVGSIPGAIKGFVSDMVSAGKDLIGGMITGIKNKATDLVNSAKGVVGDAVAGAKNLLKIKSPSRVFKEIGEYTGEGMVIGLDGKASSVKKAADNMVAQAMPDNLDTKFNLDYATTDGLKTTLRSAVNGTVDVNNRDEALIGAINELRRDMRNLRVEMDGRDVGYITAPYVNEKNNREDRRFKRR